MIKQIFLAAGILGFVANSGTVFGAADANHQWPAMRGPLDTGESPTANPPLTWSETENVKWKVKIPGRGAGVPIIWENAVFLQTAIRTGQKMEQETAEGDSASRQPGRRGPRSEKPDEKYQFVLMRLNRADGKVAWQRTLREEVPHEGHHQDHTFASASPITDGTNVYAWFGSRGLHALNLNGDLLWQKDLGRMQTKNGFGEGSSPALGNGILVVNWDHEGADFIAGFEATTGRELWRTPRDEDTSWTSPLIVEHEGKFQVVMAATRKIRSYDLATGKLIWEGPGLTANAIPTPVSAGGVVYATSGFRGNALYAIQLGKTGDISNSDAILWRHNRGTPYVPSPLLYKERLYLFSGNNGILSSFDVKDGRTVIDAERIEGLQGVYASPVAANGKIYLVGRNGATVVIRAGDKFEVLATNRLEEKFDVSPALAGSDLLLRGHEHLYCLSGKDDQRVSLK